MHSRACTTKTDEFSLRQNVKYSRTVPARRSVKLANQNVFGHPSISAFQGEESTKLKALGGLDIPVLGKSFWTDTPEVCADLVQIDVIFWLESAWDCGTVRSDGSEVLGPDTANPQVEEAFRTLHASQARGGFELLGRAWISEMVDDYSSGTWTVQGGFYDDEPLLRRKVTPRDAGRLIEEIWLL